MTENNTKNLKDKLRLAGSGKTNLGGEIEEKLDQILEQKKQLKQEKSEKKKLKLKSGSSLLKKPFKRKKSIWGDISGIKKLIEDSQDSEGSNKSD